MVNYQNGKIYKIINSINVILVLQLKNYVLEWQNIDTIIK